MKKVISLLLTVMLASSLLVGCGNKASDANAKETTTNTAEVKSGATLTVLTNRTDIVDTDLKKFGDDYKAKTGITIKWEAITDYDGDVKVRLNSDNYGDVLLIPNGIANKDLPQFFEPLGKNTDSDLKDYAYTDDKAVKNDDGSYTTYGLTYGLGADGIVYNKATLKKAGIDKFPTTYDEWIADAAKLKEKGIVPLATNFKDKWPMSCWDSMALPFSQDGAFWNKIYQDKTPFAADRPNGKALNVLYKFVSSGFVEKDLTTTNWEQSKADLGQGKVAMMILGTWAVPQMQQFAANKDDIGFAPVPVDNSGKLFAVAGPDWRMGVSKKSKNKKEARDLLFAFINSDFADKQGFIPVKKSAKSSNPVVKDFLASGVTILYTTPGPKGDEGDKKDKIANKAAIDLYGGLYVQNVAIAAKKSKAEFDKAIADLNARWEKSKNELGY